MTDQTVIVFDRDGDPQTGLQPWEPIAAEDLVSGSPLHNGHTCFSTGSDRLTAGVWDAPAHVERRNAYPVDEFMFLLEGSLDIENEDGTTQTFHAGEACFIPKGAVLQWQQSEYLRKFWVIHDNPGAKAAAAGLQAMLVDPNATLVPVTGLEQASFESDIPQMGLLSLYQDPEGKFHTGVWDCSPMKRIPATIERSELMHILEGSGSITNADGVVFEFKAGDTFLVPVGMGYQWQNHEYVKKLFCSYTP
jgi:uncharacterized cupin superfamily protein